jgi:DNA-binding IclR family transcriptional regulator
VPDWSMTEAKNLSNDAHRLLAQLANHADGHVASRDMAETTGLSRTAVRLAMLDLKRQNLAHADKHHGYRLTGDGIALSTRMASEMSAPNDNVAKPAKTLRKS